MSAETVINKIEEKAKEASLEIIKEAEAQAQKTRETIIEDANMRKKKIIASARQNAEITKKGILQSAELNSSLLALKTKREAMEEVKKEAKKRILEADEKAIVSLFIKHLKDSKLEGSFEVIPSPAHKAVIEKNIDALMENAGVTLTLSEKLANIDAGFILSCEIYDIDFSIDNIINEAFEKNEKTVHNILFETGETL